MFKNFIINKIRVGYTLKLSEVHHLDFIINFKGFFNDDYLGSKNNKTYFLLKLDNKLLENIAE